MMPQPTFASPSVAVWGLNRRYMWAAWVYTHPREGLGSEIELLLVGLGSYCRGLIIYWES
jgi:hypothetical protein